MAISMTTQDVIANNSRLLVFEKLEIKRRYSTGFEASWVDISKYLLFTNASKIAQRLDFDAYGYGQFKTGTAKFTVDNSHGTFNNEFDLYSLFSGTLSRHYTKVRYHAGYKDEDGNNVDEVVFEGLINGKAIKQEFETGTMVIDILAYEQILTERTIAGSAIINSVASLVIGDIFNGDISITDFINFSSGNIIPGNDLTFDDATKFEKKKVSSVLNDIAKKTNSVWYVDATQNIIFKSRDANANTPFAFIGGARQSSSVNILSIDFFDDGFRKIINEVKYTSGSSITLTASTTPNTLAKHGTNQLALTGEDITTQATIDALSTAIIAANEDPKKRVILTTVYMPNVIAFLDKCTVDYRPTTTFFGEKPFLFNADEVTFNDGFFFGAFSNQNIIKDTARFKYFGFMHDVKSGTTRHYLIEI